MVTAAAPESVLIIGATGRTGQACIRQFAAMTENTPAIHAFCRSPDKLAQQKGLASIVQGDARNPEDLQRALEETKADFVVVSVGNGDNVGKADIRTANAKGLVQVLQKPNFQNVRVVVISSTGAGPSTIKVGMGIGKMIEHHLRHILHDHSGQELAFAAIHDRVTIVRPTSLTEGAPTGHLKEFGDKVKSPTIKTDRADLAAWVVNEAVLGHNQGASVNVTGAKQ